MTDPYPLLNGHSLIRMAIASLHGVSHHLCRDWALEAVRNLRHAGLVCCAVETLQKTTSDALVVLVNGDSRGRDVNRLRGLVSVRCC